MNIKIKATFFGIFTFVSVSLAYGQNLPKALLLTGNGNEPKVIEGYPPWIHEFHTEMVSEILSNIVVTETTSDLGFLNDETLKDYDLIISYSLFLSPNKEQLDALYDFISQGKSLLTLHCGILSFLNWDRYEEVMGGIFIGGPSSEPTRFNISTTNMEFWGYDYSFRENEEHPVSKVVDDFEVEDELYYFQPSTPEFEVIARAENHPVMWWHPVGKGKVMSLTLGHGAQVKKEQGYRQLLENGARWLLNFPLIKAPKLKPFSTREKKYQNVLNLAEITYSNDSNLVFEISHNDDNLLPTTERGFVDLEIGKKAGNFEFLVSARNSNGFSTENEIEAQIVEDGDGNIASYYGNKVYSSSTEAKNILFDSKNVIDGNPTTRWASDFVDPSWIMLDLQKTYEIGRIKLTWEDSYATEYTLEISENGENWNTIADVLEGDGKTDEFKFKPEIARFVRVIGKKRFRPNYGYSIFEIEVYKQ
ncbi:ThuA domain-containing protein [Pseudozobellia sp. WGM2]|uniref:ThuA domain-containing protein n=1 Tax=Pseudozobellia sp. WGM2 TaxID=2787625 RepID=UPI001ADF3407|nr:ThuA domain-containing protein [Pseudozobellia sp. WGM2]